MSDLPKIPLHLILPLRDKLFRKVFSQRTGQTIAGDIFDQLVRHTRQEIPGQVTSDAIRESLRFLTGTELTRQVAYSTAWRLAANTDKLKAGQPAPPWVCQRQSEWAAIEILSCKRDRNRYDKHGYRFKVRFLSGEAAGLETSCFWDFRIAKMAGRAAGFSFNPSSGYKFVHPSQLVGLRLFVFIEATRSTNVPYFFQFDCPGTLVSWNRKNVLQTRLRLNGNKCPREFTHACHVCAIGRSECAFATHDYTYYADFCNKCQKNGQAFDPADPTYCVNCTTEIRLGKQQEHERVS